MKHILFILALLVALVVLPQKPTHAAVAERLPDLAMAPLRDFQLEITPTQRRLLRFTAEIVNLGEGPFELAAQRASTGEQTMTQIQQHIIDQVGNWRSTSIDTSMYFAGDGHLHWHVRDLELYTLEAINSATPVGISAKGGFCFSDNRPYQTLANAPLAPVYTSCGKLNDLNVMMGLSVGWGDIYGANLPDQYIDVTDLPPGEYRLRAIADPKHLFVEQDATNNTTTIVLKLSENAVQAFANAVYLLLTSEESSQQNAPQINADQHRYSSLLGSSAFICGYKLYSKEQ